MDEDYPRSLEGLETRFATEAACLAYLAALRWPDDDLDAWDNHKM